jgi:hypothetical protein
MKNFTVVLILSCSSFASFSQNYSLNLVACYPFSGNANDLSGNNHNGILQGSPMLTNDRFGNPNSAYLFNGSTDRINIGNLASIIDTGNDVSISAWVQPNILKTQTIIMADSDEFLDRFNFMAYYSNSGSPLAICDFGDCTNGGRLTHLMPSFSNAWEHYVFNVCNSQGYMKIFRNGALLDSLSSAAPLINRNKTLYIGYGLDQAGSLFYFNGKIDDLRIYTRVLSDQEVQGLYLQNISCASNVQCSFSSSDTTFCDKKCIDFTDLSTNNPTSWNWYFSGAVPSFSALQNPLNICYNSFGSFDVSLVACNASGCDSINLPGFIKEFSSPAIPAILQSNDTLYTSYSSYSYTWHSTTNPGNILSSQSYFVPTIQGSYYVIVCDSLGCCASSELFILNSVKELAALNPSIGIEYFGDKVKVDLYLSEQCEYRFSLFDLAGRIIQNSKQLTFGKNINIEINTNKLNAGIYFLAISTGIRNQYLKLFVP